MLEKQNLVFSRVSAGEGPDRKIYEVTPTGRKCLKGQIKQHLGFPGHAKSEVDLGIYALPFLSLAEGQETLNQCRTHLQRRREFLAERFRFCQKKKLGMPALAFERSLRLIDEELLWISEVLVAHQKGQLQDIHRMGSL
jgi:DNA-binding PadR family transcriptional regulator